MHKQEIDLIYKDILFAHHEYSSSIFDSMYELIEKFRRDESYLVRESIKMYGMDDEYLGELRQLAISARHFMKIKSYITKHNYFLESFNEFIHIEFNLPPLPIYEPNKHEEDPKKLPMNEVLDELNIIKLYEQYIHYDINNNQRKALKLQMFYENAIRKLLNETKRDFYEIISDTESMCKFKSLLMGTSCSSADDFMSKMKELNMIRNKIKHDSDYDYELYNSLDSYSPMVKQFLRDRIDEIDFSSFDSSFSLIMSHLAFRELPFSIKYKYFNQYGDFPLEDNNVYEYYKYDRAYQCYYINRVMEGIMDHKSDFKKVEENIIKFQQLVETLSDTNDSMEYALENLSDITDIKENLVKLNKEFGGINKVNFSNLEALIKSQENIPNNVNLGQVLENLNNRIDTMNDISKTMKSLNDKVKKLEKKIDSLSDEIEQIKIG